MREFVVFYAWQSDTLQRFNRHLIRFALNLAAQNISDDPVAGVRVRVDADTEGVLGHVPITETILKKIAACDVFVPDLTFVAVNEAGDLVPNPNVMLEYGYALRAKSYSVMIPVMNTAYGPAEKLPFDMGHLRHPLQYDLPTTARNVERRAVREKLTEEFERILRLMVIEAPSQQMTPFPEATSVHTPAFFFPRGAAIATFGFPGEQEYQFEGDRAIYLRLFPKYADGQPRPGRANIKLLLQSRRIVSPMSSAIGGIASANDYGWVVIDPASNSLTQGITQVFPTGELWGVNSKVFTVMTMGRNTASPEAPGAAIGIISAEKLCARALENYVEAATSEMKLRPPFIVELGAVGLKDVFMGAPHPEFSSGHYYGPIREKSLVRRYELFDTQQVALFNVLRQFFDEFYDLAECIRADVLSDELTRKNAIPTRC
jgi:hypothetical protein